MGCVDMYCHQKLLSYIHKVYFLFLCFWWSPQILFIISILLNNLTFILFHKVSIVLPKVLLAVFFYLYSNHFFNQWDCLNFKIRWALTNFIPNDKYNWRFLYWRTYLPLLPIFGTNLLTPPILCHIHLQCCCNSLTTYYH